MVKKTIGLCLAVFLCTAVLYSVCAGLTVSGRGSRYVVVAQDTPQSVLARLEQDNIPYITYRENRALYGGSGENQLEALRAYDSIYLCEGTYNAASAPFLILGPDHANVRITGEGPDKTKIIGAPGSLSPAVELQGAGKRTVRGVTVEGLFISGFQYGVYLNKAQEIKIQNNRFIRNSAAGLYFADASFCSVNDNELTENGGDDGFGVMLLYHSVNNTGENNLYRNNGGGNVMDFPARGERQTPADNPISYTFLRDRSRKAKTMESVRAEAELGQLSGGASARWDNYSFPSFSGSGYVDLYGGSITLTPFVKTAGWYELSAGLGKTDSNNKCDLVIVNGDTYYTATAPNAPSFHFGSGAVGELAYQNGYVAPSRPSGGIWLREGKNTITIQANWGYASYDYVDLIPIGFLEASLSSGFSVNRETGNITGILPQTPVQELLAGLFAQAGGVSLETADRQPVAVGMVPSGMRVSVSYGGQVKERFETVVYGDINGDGAVRVDDAVQLKRQLAGYSPAFPKAADANRDSLVNALDVTAVKNEILGVSRIWQ